MGLFSIGARILFKASAARAQVRKFNAEVLQTSRDMHKVTKAAEKSGLTVNQFLRTMENRRAPTQFQKNVKLASSSLRTLTGLIKEGRLLWKAFAGGTARRPVRLGGIRRAKVQLRGLKNSVSGVSAKLTTMLGILGTGVGAMGAGALFSDIKTALSGSIGLAANLEASRVTFDTLLGDSAKSVDLINRITRFASSTPFQKGDLIEGSKTLLALSGRNVDENEKLLKLSAQLAALTPGRTVADVARGLRQAKFGEFEILKSFQIALSAEKMKGFGEKGGEAYTNAMLDEVRRQLQQKTGGRDLVLALSQTLTGKASTLKDNVEEISLTFGRALVDGFDIKGLLDEGITLFKDFNNALKFAMGEDLDPADLGFSTTSLIIADTILDVIERLRIGFNKARDFAKRMFEIIERNPAVTKFIAGMTALSASVGGTFAILAPLLGTLITGVGLLGIALAPFSGAIIPALKIGLAAIVLIGAPLALMIGGLVAGFMMLRRQGESVGQTLWRLGETMRPMMEQGFNRFMAWFRGFRNEVVPVLAPAWAEISDAVSQLSGVTNELFAAAFSKDNALTLKDFMDAGIAMGKVFADWLAKGVRMTSFAIRRFAKFMKNTKSNSLNFISDIKGITSAFFGLMLGVGDTGANLKTFMAGLADIVTLPFRAVISGLIQFLGKSLINIADVVRPFSSTIANQIEQVAIKARGFQTTVDEGFLATTNAIKNAGNIKVSMDGEVTASVAQPIEIDGEKVAETVSQVAIRARNAGRGGDPVSPEELGFVLEGGNRIQPVSFADVASDI